MLDAARFVRMHLNDGLIDTHRVLAPATAEQMRRLDRPGKPFTHGLGWFRRPSPVAGADSWVEHFGAGAGFWNVMRLYPERGLGVVLMTNSTAQFDFEPLMTALVGES